MLPALTWLNRNATRTSHDCTVQHYTIPYSIVQHKNNVQRNCVVLGCVVLFAQRLSAIQDCTAAKRMTNHIHTLVNLIQWKVLRLCAELYYPIELHSMESCAAMRRTPQLEKYLITNTYFVFIFSIPANTQTLGTPQAYAELDVRVYIYIYIYIDI